MHHKPVKHESHDSELAPALQDASRGVLKELPSEEPLLSLGRWVLQSWSHLQSPNGGEESTEWLPRALPGPLETVGGSHRQRQEEAPLLPVHKVRKTASLILRHSELSGPQAECYALCIVWPVIGVGTHAGIRSLSGFLKDHTNCCCSMTRPIDPDDPRARRKWILTASASFQDGLHERVLYHAALRYRHAPSKRCTVASQATR